MEHNGLKIFLSYNGQNQPIVRNIAQHRSTIGFDTSVEIFFDADHLSPGDDWIKEIEKALSQKVTVAQPQ